MLRYTCRLAAISAVLVVLASCDLAGVEDPVGHYSESDVYSMRFDTNAVELQVGDTARFSPHFYGISNGVTSNLIPETFETTYASSHPEVATAVAKGANYDLVITAVNPGTTTITATCCNQVSTTVAVTVHGQAWAFDSVSGSATGSWQDAKGSASASLLFVPRDIVYEGESYNLIYKFIGTVMIVDAFSGRPSASLSIGFANRGLPAYSYDAPKNLGLMVPGTPLTDSISLSVTWPTIPVGASLVGVEVRGSIPTGAPPNAAIVLRAYYHKVAP